MYNTISCVLTHKLLYTLQVQLSPNSNNITHHHNTTTPHSLTRSLGEDGMGKKPNWFQRLFTSKTSASSSETHEPTSTTKKKKKKKWSASFAKSREPPSKETHLSSQFVGASGIDADRHAIAVAAATAAVAEAAVAAARAAAEVVRLTSTGGTSARSGPSREVVMAAVLIQSAFRGYLARRALRALRSLVKLQALVRGHIVRKQTADMVRRMQALVRVQARARASRAQTSEFSHLRTRSSIPHNPVASPAKYEQRIRINGSTLHQFSNPKRYGSNAYSMDISQDRSYSASTWLDHWMDDFPRTHNRNTLNKDYTGDQEKVVDKILEVDTWKPHLNCKQNSMRSNSPSKYTRSFHKPTSSLSSGDNFSLSSKLPEEADEVSSWTGGNSPRVVSASSRLGSGERRSPFSPTRSEYSKRYFNGWPDHPNYMANTASYKAKVRSQSAPRQRADFEKPLLSQQHVHGYNIYQDPANSFDRLSSSSLR